MKLNISSERQKIQKIDREIIRLLVKRFNIVRNIINLKKRQNTEIKNTHYEKFLEKKHLEKLKNKLYKELFANILRIIFSSSRDYQKLLSSRDEK